MTTTPTRTHERELSPANKVRYDSARLDVPRRFCRPRPYTRLYVAVTDKIYVKNHRRIGSQLETRIPRSAFSGATLDLLYSGEGLSKLDDATQERVLDFAEDFLDCDCESNPYCGHPERKFMRYLLDLRAQGLGPDAIVDVMGDEYLVTAYPGDVLSFLDGSVRTLEAMEDLANVEGDREMEQRVSERKRDLL